jgi:hypothetical protein
MKNKEAQNNGYYMNYANDYNNGYSFSNQQNGLSQGFHDEATCSESIYAKYVPLYI